MLFSLASKQPNAYHSNELSLVLLGRCLRVANFAETPKGEVRRIPILSTSVNKDEITLSALTIHREFIATDYSARSGL